MLTFIPYAVILLLLGIVVSMSKRLSVLKDDLMISQERGKKMQAVARKAKTETAEFRGEAGRSKEFARKSQLHHERLKKENVQLREENSVLRSRLSAIPDPGTAAPESNIVLRRQVIDLKARTVVLERENEVLRSSSGNQTKPAA